MASVVSICNLALNLIGQRSITSLSENTNASRACNLIYDTIRDSVLRDNNWNFASITEELTLLSNETIPGWDFIYVYPVKSLAVRKIIQEGDTEDQLPHPYSTPLAPTSKQRCIATNVEYAYAEYTYQVTDPNLYDGTFIDALSFRLASSLAQSIAGNAQLSQQLLTAYRNIVDQAKLSNAREGSPKRNNYSALVGVR